MSSSRGRIYGCICPEACFSIRKPLDSVSGSIYVPVLRVIPAVHAWAQMCELHALPEDWQEMDYADFLEQRRHLMADIIRRGFESLR